MSDNLEGGDDFALSLYKLRAIPPYVVLAALAWVIHDYCENKSSLEFLLLSIVNEVITLEDEVTYFWSKKPRFGALIFFWIRYYTIFLVVFDTIETHMSMLPLFDIQTLILGAISLWSVEVVMQLRIYVLFNRSKRVAFLNGILFVISIAIFLWIMIENTLHRSPIRPDHQQVLKSTCPPLNEGSRGALWAPATLFEFILFGMAVYKTIFSSSAKIKLNGRRSLAAILLHENIIYFFAVACILVLNNLMVVCSTHVPWFGFGPFHASLGIATCRMLIHLRKFAEEVLEVRTGTHFLQNLEVDSSVLVP